MDANFLRYNALDAATMMEIHNEIWDELDTGGFTPAYDLTISLLDPLIYMMTRGIAVNMDAMNITKQEITETIKLKQAELNTLCGRELNVNSPKDCQKYFYIELGIPPYYNDGAITVDDTALQRLSRPTAKRPGLRQAKLVQDIRGLQKLFGTYLDIEFDADKRMRCSYNPRGTKFGRLSSSKTIFGTGTNQQNLPQEFKKFLVADPGYVLWEVDKRQAEWVVVAYLTGDANMISVVESGMDTHIHTASLMFRQDKELIAKEAKLVGTNSDPDTILQIRVDNGISARVPRTMSLRQCGKKSNHGLNYAEGPNQFALINEMSETEAKVVVELYHNIYPGIRIWYESIKRQLQKDRSLTNCFGRKVRFMDQWGEDLWKAAYSMLPQSTVVDSLNIGMKKLYADNWITKILNVDLLAQVHDSILMQVPYEVANHKGVFEDLKARVYEYVSPELKYNNRTFKLATDSKIGLNWGGWNPENNPDGMKESRVRELPDFLDAYLTYVQNSEPSVTYHTWAGISLLAGALQRKVKLTWGFEEIHCNMYIIFVGPAGRARKGVALGIAKNLLLNIPGVSVAAESCTRESMILAMKRAITNYQDPTSGKITIHCSLTAFSEELSVLLGQSDVKLLANLCDWWDSKSVWTYETVGRGRDSLEGLCFNLLGATAPEWIQSMLPTEAIGGGFTSRCIFIVEESKGKVVAKHQLTNSEIELGNTLERDLERISQLKGHYTFSPKGSSCYEAWYTEQERLLSLGQPAVEDNRFAAYCERRATHIRKLAMILSASRCDNLVIEEKDFHRAVEILTFAERKMGRTFGGLGKAKHSDAQAKIMDYIQRLKITTRSAVLSKFHRDIDAVTLLEIERTMEEMKIVTIQYNLQTKEKIYRWVEKEK